MSYQVPYTFGNAPQIVPAEQLDADFTYVTQLLEALGTGNTLFDYTALRAYIGPSQSIYIYGAPSYLVPPGPTAGFFYLDHSDTTSADNGGTIIVGVTGRRWKRLLNPAGMYIGWFGAIGDGVADDTAAVQAFFNAVSGSTGVCSGTYRLTSLVTISLSNCRITGEPGKTTFTGGFDWAIMKLLDMSNVVFGGITFISTTVKATQDGGTGVVYLFQNSFANLHFQNCVFSSPNANTNGLSLYVNINTSDTNTGLGLYVDDCTFLNCGRMGLLVMNRSGTPSLMQDIWLRRSIGQNLGLGGDYGFLVSLDGTGLNGGIDDNLGDNCLGCVIENTGFSGMSHQRNRGQNFSRICRLIQVAGDTPSTDLTIRDNICVTPCRAFNYLINLDNSFLSGNVWDMALQTLTPGAMLMRGVSNCRFSGEYYKSDQQVTVQIEGGSFNNHWDSLCVADNTPVSTGTPVIFRFTDNNSGLQTTTNNIWDGGVMKRGSVGIWADQDPGGTPATGNVVRIRETTPTDQRFNILTFAMPDADTTASGDMALQNYDVIILQGTLTGTRKLFLVPSAFTKGPTLIYNQTNQIIQIAPVSTVAYSSIAATSKAMIWYSVVSTSFITGVVT